MYLPRITLSPTFAKSPITGETMELKLPSALVQAKSKEVFREMLLAGEFPKLKFEIVGEKISYEDTELYLVIFALYRTVLHNKLKEFGYAEGIFTLAESRNFRRHLDRIARSVTVQEMSRLTDRLVMKWEIGRKFPTQEIL